MELNMGITFKETCKDYLTDLRSTRKNMMATDELSLHLVLDTFLNNSVEIFKHSIQIILEPKKTKAGRPDFVFTANGLPVGYIEAEAYGIDLGYLTGHAKEQNDRFRANLDNFLLTNYLEFHLYIGGELVDSAKLSAPADKGKVKVHKAEIEALALLLERFLSGQLPSITSPKNLAQHLARRARQMSVEVLYTLKDQSSERGEMVETYNAFKQVLLPDLTWEAFSDMYAQAITYGLFAARCTSLTVKEFTRLSAANLVPKTNPFLRRLFQRIAAFDLDKRVAWIADDTARLLAQAPITEILADFGKRTAKEDPVVHFYETFLAAYNPKLREIRGVYYTPESVVGYIVRSIDYLLKTYFKKPMGLADENTLILDPAVGTGSFLFAIVNHVYETVCKTIGKGAWSDYVNRKLLTRLFGFELLVAPFAVAHLKLGLLIQEMGYQFTGNQRLGIYLTNTLEEAIKKSELLLGSFISEEANEAVAIKREQPILVVLGNPPYSVHSANRSEYIEFILPGGKYVARTKRGLVKRKAGPKGVKIKHKTFIGTLIEDYKKVDGKPLGEQNPKLLHDDYVKFIRFAQWRIEQTGEGVVGYITNHGYVDNPTFRGMRQNLIETFSEIYVYNLHGNIRKKERTPEGGKDENVFDIQQGVAILLCVKHKDQSQPARVYYADLWGLGKDKNKVLAETDVNKTEWTQISHSKPFYLFEPQDDSLFPEYEQGWKITDIMPLNSTGIKTHRDHFVIDFDLSPLQKRIKDFRDLSVSDDEISRKYKLQDKQEWKLSEKRQSLAIKADWEKHFLKCLYRPFDERAYYHYGGLVDRPRHKVMRHMLMGENLGFITTRQITSLKFCHVLCSTVAVEMKTCSHDRGTYFFPLYKYPDEDTKQLKVIKETKRRLNISPEFLSVLAKKLKLPQTKPFDLPKDITPEDIFYYAYAVFHSPSYREFYAEFLKRDFPRLPLTGDIDLFRDLSDIGKELVALHLLDTHDAPVLNHSISPFPVVGNNIVQKVQYVDTFHRVYINKDQYFENIPQNVWEFSIGGYQVCNKWLKDRKKRKLTIDDVQHYQRIVVSLIETMRCMEKIDERIPRFPIP